MGPAEGPAPIATPQTTVSSTCGHFLGARPLAHSSHLILPTSHSMDDERAGWGSRPGRARKWQLGQGLEPWPVTLMAYGDTPGLAPQCLPRSQPQNRVQPLVTQMQERDQRWDCLPQVTPPVGVAGPAPLYLHRSTERGWPGHPWAPRSATRTRPGKHHADWQPRTRALPWHLVRKHNCGSHRLSG